MSPFSIFLLLAFAILIVVFVVLTISNKKKNEPRQRANIIVPFAGYLGTPNTKKAKNSKNVGTDPDPAEGLYLVGMAGGQANNVPQIQCPVGSTINIIGAFVETNDPFGTCYGKPDPLLKLSCGSRSDTSSAQTCQTSDECPQGMTCDATKKCLPINTCKAHTDCVGNGPIGACDVLVGTSCPTEGVYNDSNDTLVCRNGIWVLDPAYGQCMMCDPRAIGGVVAGTCKNIPLCTNINNTTEAQNLQNVVCGLGKNRCKIRDASAYLAGKCDGKTTCLGSPADIWSPNTPGGHFGPLPCDIPATISYPCPTENDANKMCSNNDYQNMPITPGWNQSAVPAGGGKQGANASFSQGYYVHGIYTCIPDDEIASAKNST